jgi:predicted 3-demethylubiquinone-9 3-methyltransferase (glyoxalase superfamily)
MQKITALLTFNDQAEQAMKFYPSIFPNSKILSLNALGGSRQLQGQEFAALKGGPSFSFAEGNLALRKLRDARGDR